jgi:hypothetical protein
MSMVFWKEGVPRSSCPSCTFVNEGREGDVEWLATSPLRGQQGEILIPSTSENCHMTYRRIEEIEERPKKRIQSRRTPVSREVSPQQLPTQPEDEYDEISKFRRVHLITNKDNQQTRHLSASHSPAITSSPGDAATPGQAISTRNLPDGPTPNPNPGRVFAQDLPWADYYHWRTNRGSGGAECTTVTPVYPGCDLPPPGRYSNVPMTIGETVESYSTLSFVRSSIMPDRFLDWLFEGV